MKGGYENLSKATYIPIPTSQERMAKAEKKIDEPAEKLSKMPDSELLLRCLEETHQDYMRLIESIGQSVNALKKDEMTGLGLPHGDSEMIELLKKLHTEYDGLIPAIASKIIYMREGLGYLREIQRRLATIVG